MDVISQIVRQIGLRQDVTDTVRQYLDGESESRSAQLGILQTILEEGAEADEQVCSVIDAAWVVICERQLWLDEFDDIDAFKNAVRFPTTVQPTIDRHKALTQYKQKQEHAIGKAWGVRVTEVFSTEWCPSAWGKHTLEQIGQLSRLATFDDAMEALWEGIKSRPERSRNTSVLKTSDVDRAIAIVRKKTQNCEKEKIASSNSSSITTPMSRPSRIRRVDYANEDDTTAQAVSPFDGNTLDDGQSDDSGNDIENDQANQETAPLKALRRKANLDYCSCSVGVKNLIDGIVIRPNAPYQSALLTNLLEMTSFESICRNHLRRLAGNALGMVTNITTLALQDNLKWIYLRKRKMERLRRARKSWFRGQSGDVWRETPPTIARGAKGERDDFHFDAAQVFRRFAGDGSWDRWLQNGTLILPNVFDHLRGAEPEIQSEFDLYAFHLGEQPGLPTMGWMRNMYHSGVQQLVYQDPVLWALTAAARPDKHWRLIAYPYNAKNAAAGQKTGFLHLDLDLKRHQSEGLGKNMVQSTVSLTEENDKGCTLVVPGFHKHFQEWVDIKRDVIDSRITHRCTTTEGND